MASYYANADERARLIAGFRALADFLQDHPDVPAPRWADVMVFPPDGTDEEMRAEIDQIAARIGADPTDRTATAVITRHRATSGPSNTGPSRSPPTRVRTSTPATRKEPKAMTLVITLFAATFLAGATIGLIAIIIGGIRREDRAKTLTDAPRTHVEAATRRMLGVGVRQRPRRFRRAPGGVSGTCTASGPTKTRATAAAARSARLANPAAANAATAPAGTGARHGDATSTCPFPRHVTEETN